MVNDSPVKPLVSVLMTAYNREKYIAEAIQSVLSSSYTNFELIIVDDRSSDRTVEIARSFEKRDSRIRVYVNEQNLTQTGIRRRLMLKENILSMLMLMTFFIILQLIFW
jgi:glycosyltransferase involved in cell wall biosynthesis